MSEQEEIITIGSLADPTSLPSGEPDQEPSKPSLPSQMMLPKKPVAAFMQFKSEQLGDKWKELSAEEMKRYTDAYQHDKENGISRPKSTYLRFVDDQQISQKWAQLDPQLKQNYKTNFTNQQKQYAVDIETYDSIYAAKALRAPKFTKFRIPQPFHFYCEKVKSNAELNGKSEEEIGIYLEQSWNELSDAEKQPFVDQTSNAQAQEDARLLNYELEWGNIDYINSKKEEAAVENEENDDKDESNDNGEEEQVKEDDLLSKKRPANASKPRPSKIAKKSESPQDLAAQKENAEKNLLAGYNYYCKVMLEKEAEKFFRKISKGKDTNAAVDQIFECNKVLSDVKARWETLSDKTRAQYVRDATGKRNSFYEDDEDEDDAEIATPNESDDENYSDENVQDDESDESNAEEIANKGNKKIEKVDDEEDDEGYVQEDDEDDDKVDNLDNSEEDSRENDIKNYGDDGDNFVCGDDEIEYQDGVTSEEIREAQEQEKKIQSVLSMEFMHVDKKKKK